MKLLRSLLVAVAGYLINGPLLAACFPVGTHPPTQVVDVNFGNVAVSADAAVGAVLATKTVGGTSNWHIKCDKRFEKFTVKGTSSRPGAGIANVFSTGVAGIGYKINVNARLMSWSYQMQYTPNGGNGSSSIVAGVASGAVIYLVKTGPVTPGALPSMALGEVTLGLRATQVVSRWRFTGGQISVPSCSAIGPQTLDLGRLSAKSIDSNTTAGEAFVNVKMSCSAGLKVSVGFNPIGGAAGANATGLIKNQGTAGGVAVQLIDGNRKAIPFAQWIGITNGGANTTYWVGARAYKVGAVTAGTINAQATLSVTYQ